MSHKFSSYRLDVLRRAKYPDRKILADLIGADVPQIWRWENGENIPGGAWLGKLADALDCRTDDFYDVD